MGPSRATFEVVQPGLQTTVQDAGRPGHRHEGVPLAGAADPVGLAVANLLAGNEPGAAALECTLLGPELIALRDAWIGLAGGDLGARMLPAGGLLRPGRGTALRAGDRLAFGTAASSDGSGCRAYVAVAGGLNVPYVLGSRSTSLVGRFGGFEGRALRAGDVLATPASAAADPVSAPAASEIAWPADLRLPQPGDPIRVLPGPLLGDGVAMGAALAALVGVDWRVAAASDRRGVRLEGPAVPPPGDARAGSHGVLPGAVQVTPAGQPLVLLADAGPTGGYSVAAVVIAADLGLVGQAPPGGVLRFRLTDPEAARVATAELRRTLAAAPARLGRRGDRG